MAYICGEYVWRFKNVSNDRSYTHCLPIMILSIEYSMVMYESDKKRYIKIGKYLIVIFAVLSFLAVVIPDKETCLTMLAVYYITPDNIQVVQGNIIDFVGQLANAVKGVK